MGQENINNILEKYRSQIDLIDEEILNLFSERFEIVKLIGIIKTENNISLLQPDRFKKMLNNLKSYSGDTGISSEFIENIWNLIHDESLKIEKLK